MSLFIYFLQKKGKMRRRRGVPPAPGAPPHAAGTPGTPGTAGTAGTSDTAAGTTGADVLLLLTLCAHVLCCPFTKVEESFNVQVRPPPPPPLLPLCLSVVSAPLCLCLSVSLSLSLYLSIRVVPFSQCFVLQFHLLILVFFALPPRMLLL